MKEALRWWPTWLNTTAYPYFSLSPGQFVSVGGVVPKEQGFPTIKITQMRSCDGEDPPPSYFNEIANFEGKQQQQNVHGPIVRAIAVPFPSKAAAAPTKAAAAVAPTTTKPSSSSSSSNDKTPSKGTTSGAAASPASEAAPADTDSDNGSDDDAAESSIKGKKDCSIVTGTTGLKARWCVDLKPYVWVEPRRKRRFVRVQGEVTNLQPNVSLCGIVVQLESNKSAVSTWPEWFPDSGDDAPLDPGQSFCKS